MKVAIIAAVARNRAIGRSGALLWRLPADMAHFKAVTTGAAVVMGRKTWESIGRPLPGRLNIVVSRDPKLDLPGEVVLCGSLREALDAAAGRVCCYVIGGGQIYAEAMSIADEMDLTMVHDAPEDADTFFPEIDPAKWVLVDSEPELTDEASGTTFHFERYRRVK